MRLFALRSSALGWCAPRIAALVLTLCAALPAPSRADDRVRVALVPLVVHSADGRDFLQRGLADMLVSRIGRERRIAVLPIDDAKAATADADAAREVGAANGAAWVVFGSFTHFADGASLDLACTPVRESDGEPRRIYVHAATMADMIPLLDKVAERAAAIVLGGADAAPAAASPPAGGEPTPPDRDAGRVR
ncbi:MAG: hypothetical protein DCC71_13015 [Proteobacteria bacterium]|nr:MAG: hypothetical protein DCC71_13015 [Pseudomonadota bacterium]